MVNLGPKPGVWPSPGLPDRYRHERLAADACDVEDLTRRLVDPGRPRTFAKERRRAGAERRTTLVVTDRRNSAATL